MNLQENLAAVGREVETILRNDEFPNRVRPAELADAVRDYPLRGGKRLRPALLTWCCELAGGDFSRARFAAAAVEVWHNWTLVHDDIIDRDEVRRGAPTCHVTLRKLGSERLGIDFAILCGDLQQAWANHLLMRSIESGVPPALVIAISRKLQALAGADLISGEAVDTLLPERPLEAIAPGEAIAMIRGKTGALLQFAAETGAMIGLDRSDDPRIARLGEGAMELGIAFQLRDDHLGIFGDLKTFGKPIGADLRERKATPLLLSALRMATPTARTELLKLLGRDHYSEADLELARTIFTVSGAAAENQQEIRRRSDRAAAMLTEFPDSPARERLLALFSALTGRDK